ncbi:hypothetical protein [Novispirillum itersonii]|uniref:pEK499-p136 HEPN domain-containing protein n=1 Tax=Novispirillum itersonii TaxID=189 RepID=A0A7X0DML3_NOVIT|nr:hypothetical protein [Novispirillum itersonii]MBB6211171.1 hypothetical protein [Novispirillum itersonii]
MNDIRERYHVAKLTLFNVRLMSEMQRSDDPGVQKLISSEITKNKLSPPVSLLHQGSFVSVAYVCLVWLWESVKIENKEKEFLDKIPENAEILRLKIPSNDKINGPRKVSDWKAVLRLVRNALSHGKVQIEDDFFIFHDQDRNRGEKLPTYIKLTWEELGKISEICIYSCKEMVTS